MTTSTDRFVRLTLDDRRTITYPSFNNPNDIGATPAAQAVQMLNVGEYFVSFITVFEDLKSEVAQWIDRHQEKISKACITVREESIVLLVATRGFDLDDDFEDELSDMAIAIKQNSRFSQIPFTVQSLPCCEGECFEAFCNPNFTFGYKINNAVH